MRATFAFSSLMARPAMVVWGLLILSAAALLITGLCDEGVPGLRAMDGVVLSCLGFPFALGILSGWALREFQHTSFAWTLPGARTRGAVGFLTIGLVSSAVVLVFASVAEGDHLPLPLLLLGWASYGLSAWVVHPAASWTGSLGIFLLLSGIWFSEPLGQFGDGRPFMASAAWLALLGLLCWHLFRDATLRAMPFRQTAPTPGAFSLGQSLDVERTKWMKRTRTESLPAQRSLRNASGPWVSAALYETHGDRPWRTALRVLSRLGWLFALIALHALLDHRDEFPASIGKSLYESLFRPPHLPPYGEKPPHPAVALWISGIGSTFFFTFSITLRTGLLYPLSRGERAAIAYLSSVIQALAFTTLMGLTLLLVGYTSGALTGQGLLLSYVPFFVRPLLITLILLPLAQFHGLRVSTTDLATRSHALAGLLFGIIVFVTVVTAFSLIPPRGVSWIECATLVGLLIPSQGLYWLALKRRFAHSDL